MRWMVAVAGITMSMLSAAGAAQAQIPTPPIPPGPNGAIPWIEVAAQVDAAGDAVYAACPFPVTHADGTTWCTLGPEGARCEEHQSNAYPGFESETASCRVEIAGVGAECVDRSSSDYIGGPAHQRTCRVYVLASEPVRCDDVQTNGRYSYGTTRRCRVGNRAFVCSGGWDYSSGYRPWRCRLEPAVLSKKKRKRRR